LLVKTRVLRSTSLCTRGLQVEVHGFFVCTCFANNSSPLVAANTYSLLTELSHVISLGNESTGERASRRQLFESREAPFDYVSWVPANSRATDTNSSDALNAVARYLALEWTPDARAMLRSCRVSPTPREQSCGESLTFRMSGYASLADQNASLLASWPAISPML
jgi:hypothetical protein